MKSQHTEFLDPNPANLLRIICRGLVVHDDVEENIDAAVASPSNQALELLLGPVLRRHAPLLVELPQVVKVVRVVPRAALLPGLAGRRDPEACDPHLG